MENSLLILFIGTIFGLCFLIGGIIFLKNSKKYELTSGECTDCYYGIKTRIAVVKYEFKNKTYEMRKHIPFSEIGSKYKIKINPLKPDKAYCWYDTFLGYESIIVGIFFIIATFVNHL
jgi:hypothetical protein